MYRLISWSFDIVCFYQAFKYHHLGFLITGIAITALMLVAAPLLMSLDDKEVSPPA